MRVKILLIALLLLLSFCSRSEKQEPILAKVGNRPITVDAFLNRVYFSPRPAFCAGTSEKDKAIVLWNFIAEKVLAIAAEKDPAITSHPRLLNFLQGIKEQAMRQLLFQKEALEKVKLNPVYLNKIVQNAARTYKAEALFIAPEDSNQNNTLLTRAHIDSFAFESLKKSSSIVKNLTLTFYNAQHPQIFEKLFLEPVTLNQIIGPISLENDRIVVLRILSYKTVKNLSEIEQHFFKNQIEQHIKMRRAAQIYLDFVSRVMKGKQLQFHLHGLKNLVALLGPVYFEKNNTIFSAMNYNDPLEQWKREVRLNSMKNSFSEILSEKVFTIEDQNWSIADVLNEMEHHPLVFRQKKFARKQFGNQLKLALVDLVRDYYLTKEAYKRGYDKVPQVKQTVNLWRDYFYSVLKKEQLLRENGIIPAQSWPLVPDSLITNLMDRLQIKVEVNKKLLESISLPKIQTLALQKNVPYPMAVPNFPLITDKTMP